MNVSYVKTADLQVGDHILYGRSEIARIVSFHNLVDKTRRGIKVEMLTKSNHWEPYDSLLQFTHDRPVVCVRPSPPHRVTVGAPAVKGWSAPRRWR